METARLETFSDGVFAIAITLLVLTIGAPTDYGRLGHEIANRWPAFAAYAVSFVIIGIMWLNHHGIFSLFERVDRGLFYLNLLLLLTVVFIPYPTGIFGEALHRGQGEREAAIFPSTYRLLRVQQPLEAKVDQRPVLRFSTSYQRFECHGGWKQNIPGCASPQALSALLIS